MSVVSGVLAMIVNLLWIPSIVAVIAGITGLRRAKLLDGLGRKKSIWGIALGVTGTIVAVVVISLLPSDVREFLLPNRVDNSGTSTRQAPAVSTDVATIVAQFEANELQADAMYQGEWVEVTGVVNKIDTEVFKTDEYVLRLGTGTGLEISTVNCHGMDTSVLSQVTTGAQVTVVGAFEDGGDFGIELQDCYLN